MAKSKDKNILNAIHITITFGHYGHAQRKLSSIKNLSLLQLAHMLLIVKSDITKAFSVLYYKHDLIPILSRSIYTKGRNFNGHGIYRNPSKPK